MNTLKLLPFLVLSLPFLSANSPSELPDDLIEFTELLFQDNFNRMDPSIDSDELGREWVTNSAHRANGQKQAFLKNHTLHIVMAEGANHSVSVRHDAPFDDGIVMLRFQIHDNKGIKFNFNDPAAKDVSWAGHISRVVVTQKKLTIGDDKTGIFDLEIHQKRRNKDLPKAEREALAEFLKTKSKTVSHSFKLNQWYSLAIVNIGPKVTVYIDKIKAAEFESEGLDHSVKQNLAFGVSGKATIDDLRILSLN